MTYRLHVVGSDVAEVITHAAGLIVDRGMAGWRVAVAVACKDTRDTGPVRILGADVIPLDTVTAQTELVHDRCALAISAELLGEARGLIAAHAEVLVWGEPVDPLRGTQHRLSAAGRAFKAQALAAAGISGTILDDEPFTAAAETDGLRTLRA